MADQDLAANLAAAIAAVKSRYTAGIAATKRKHTELEHAIDQQSFGIVYDLKRLKDLATSSAARPDPPASAPASPPPTCWRCGKPESLTGDGATDWNCNAGLYLLVPYAGVSSHPPCGRCNFCNNFLLPGDDYRVFERSLYCARCVDQEASDDLAGLHAAATAKRAADAEKHAAQTSALRARIDARNNKKRKTK